MMVTRERSNWKRTSTVRIGLVFIWELTERFQTEPLAVLERVPLQCRSRMEPKQKVLVQTPRTVLVR